MNSNKANSFLGKTVLIVNTGSPKKKFIFQKIKKLGVNIICVNPKEQVWAKPYVDHWVLTDLINYKEVIKRINLYLNQHPGLKFDGILTFWEDSVPLTSRLTDSFNMIGIPYEVSSKVRNKFMFRKFCEENGLPTPKCKIIKKREDLKSLLEDMKFPVVMKPVYGSGSVFVIKVDDEDEAFRTYDYITQNILNSPDTVEFDNFDILIEEYIDGDEVDINILMQNGKVKFCSIADNKKTEEPFFVETGMSVPSILHENDQEVLISMAEEVLEKLGVYNACVHFEAKQTKKGPVPVEVNLRMGGDEVYLLIKEAWKVDLIENILKITFGEFIPKMQLPEEPYKCLVTEDFLPASSGVLVKLDIAPDLKKNKYIEDIYLSKEVGDSILVPPEGYDYLGWIVVSGDTIPDAQDNLVEAKKLVNYEVAKFSSFSSLGKTMRKNHFSFSSVNKEILTRSAKIEKIRRMSIANQRNLHIGIACNLFSEDNPVEKDLSAVGKLIEETLKNRGYRVSFFDFNNLSKAFDDLRKSDVDMVFNVCERINESSLLEPHAASVLDALQIPYTGSNPFTLGLCIDKIRVKKLFAYHGIPTPKWDYAYSLDDEIREDLKYPLIVKPANTDNSIGITNESVVENKKQLVKQFEKILIEINRPVLVEEYIEGDEYDVTILGSEEDDLRVLPLSRSIFNAMPKGYWHIYPYEAKWAQDPTYKNGIMVQRPPKNIPKKLESLITEISLDTYNILDCHDYGRVEIRVDDQNNPYVLELNPNPSIYYNDAVPAAAKLVGMDYGDFIEEIIRMAIKRYKGHPPYYHLQPNLM